MDIASPLRDDIVATYHGVRVPAAPHLRRGMIAAMEDGTYERGEVELALTHVPKGARILELGAGSGLVGAVVARHCQPAAMLSVEANPNLLPGISALHAENGLAGLIALRHGVVLSAPDAPPSVEFFVQGNFLGSSLTPSAEATASRVPVLHYDTLRRDFPHDVILMDIEGAELDFLRHADLTGVRLLIAEFHRKLCGREGLRECRAHLSSQGFVRDQPGPIGGVQVWRRDA